MIEIGNLTLPENLNLGLPEDDLIRRGDAVNAIRKACIMGHIQFSTRTPEGRRTIEAMAAVRNVPAVDVATVVHGKWEHAEYKYAFLEGPHKKCSACGFEGKNEFLRHCKYCPNCGAKMDKED